MLNNLHREQVKILLLQKSNEFSSVPVPPTPPSCAIATITISFIQLYPTLIIYKDT